MVKNPLASAGDRVQSRCGEDPLEKEMATHSRMLAWKIPWTEEPGGLYSSWGCKESDTAEQLSTHKQGISTVPVHLEEIRKAFSLEPSEGVWPYLHFDLRLLGSKTVREYIPGVLSHLIYGKLLQQQ